MKIRAVMLCLLFSRVDAADYYIVKERDTLSEIAQRLYVENRVYGLNGTLHEILTLNKSIKNPNLIKPGQIINIRSPVNHAVLDNEKPSVEPYFSGQPSLIKANRELVLLIAAQFGLQYVSINQRGDLGNSDVGAIFYNNSQLAIGLHYGQWGANFDLDTYRFRYKSLASAEAKSMTSLRFNLSYDFLAAGLSFEQFPFFQNLNGRIDMMRGTVGFLDFGFGRKFEIADKKSAQLGAYLLTSLPLMSDFEDPQVTSLECGREIVAVVS